MYIFPKTAPVFGKSAAVFGKSAAVLKNSAVVLKNSDIVKHFLTELVDETTLLKQVIHTAFDRKTSASRPVIR